MDKKWWTLIAVCTGMFMLLLDVTIVIVAQPAIQDGLHASFTEVQWVLDAYALTLASLLLTAGVLADRYGRKLLFQIGLVIFTLGSLLCGVAQDPLMLIVSRSGQGVGGAIMFATSLALLGQSFRGRDRGVAFGVWGAVTGVSTALGPVLGGVITTNWSWRGIFLVNVPIGVLAVALTAWRVEESKSPNPTRPDWAGFALLTTGLVSLIYGLIRAGREQLVGRWRHYLPGDRGGGAGRVHRGRAARRAPHVRPVAAARADVRGRLDRGLRHERLALRRAALAGHLPAGRAGLLGAGRRPAAGHHQRGPARHRGHRRPGQRARARPLAHRARPRAGRRRADHHGRADRDQRLDRT